jgi:eukaryotic-like serine/threonine-protein kinase
MVGKTVLGRYRLLRSLGSGSNAEVFLAEPLRHPDLRVVVKRVHDHVVKSANFHRLFEAEVKSMANFDHPYAVGLVEASLTDPIGPCLVMEYVPGVTLEDLLAVEKRLSAERAGRLLGFFCHALFAAHAAGIVHRDLKPANLMIVNPGTPHESLKVMDFGFAGFAAKPHIQIAELTGHGPIFALGTPAYVSPEMVRGDRVDARSDLYSVGVILFEMLCGRLPFEHNTMERLLGAHVKEPPPRFHKIGCGDVPPAVEGVVQRALCKYPNERPQTAEELLDSYSIAVGIDFLLETVPPGWEPPPKVSPSADTIDDASLRAVPLAHVARTSSDPFHVTHEFEAYMPEKLAAAKLRGFVEDYGGHVVSSEPGLIRMRIGLPEGYKEHKTGSGIISWMTARRPSVTKGQEPIELELHMDRPDPSHARLYVVAAFHPLKDYPPKDKHNWHERCEKLNFALRQYLGA